MPPTNSAPVCEQSLKLRGEGLGDAVVQGGDAGDGVVAGVGGVVL
ncbi:MAG: hypothetical protein ACRDTH_18320 [Pseudonocardiaceae bacterium]